MSTTLGCRCKVYLKDKSYDLNIACIDIILLWFEDPKILFEYVIKNISARHINFLFDDSTAIFARFDIPNIFIFDKVKHIVVGFRDRNLNSIIILCSDNPDALYNKIASNIKDSWWRSYGTLRYYKTLILANYANVLGLNELEEAYSVVTEFAHFALYEFMNLNKLRVSKDVLERVVNGSFLWNLKEFIEVYAISLLYHFMLGDLITCFIYLRLILETAVIGLALDYKYWSIEAPIRIRSIKELHEYIQIITQSIDKKKTFGETINELLTQTHIISQNLGDKIRKLWNKLSNWLHQNSIIAELNTKMTAKQGLMAYTMMSPTSLDKDVVKDLRELTTCIQELIEIFSRIQTSWNKLISKSG
jgi:uncharacterized coiled-coil protein SlyX